jgi:hypothetical protein
MTKIALALLLVAVLALMAALAPTAELKQSTDSTQPRSA